MRTSSKKVIGTWSCSQFFLFNKSGYHFTDLQENLPKIKNSIQGIHG